MKKIIKENLLMWLFILSLGFNTAFFLDILSEISTKTASSQVQETVPEVPEKDDRSALFQEENDWETFTLALAWVESRWDDNAESNRNAVGYLQITPILVEDANRIAGKEMFTLESCRDRNESIRLFNIIQSEYNPEHDFHLALKIWNPRSKVSYHRAVMQKYEELSDCLHTI